MSEPKKPFLSITPDIDDDAIAALARTKGVPELAAPDAAPRAPRQTISVPSHGANDLVREASKPPARDVGRAGGVDAPNTSAMSALVEAVADPAKPTPRGRISYVKAGIPDYALLELKTRALREKVSLNHLLLAALKQAGIDIHDADMVEDGRRIRGNRVVE